MRTLRFVVVAAIALAAVGATSLLREGGKRVDPARGATAGRDARAERTTASRSEETDRSAGLPPLVAAAASTPAGTSAAASATSRRLAREARQALRRLFGARSGSAARAVERAAARRASETANDAAADGKATTADATALRAARVAALHRAVAARRVGGS